MHNTMKAKLNRIRYHVADRRMCSSWQNYGVLKVSRSVCDTVATAPINKLGRMIMF